MLLKNINSMGKSAWLLWSYAFLRRKIEEIGFIGFIFKQPIFSLYETMKLLYMFGSLPLKTKENCDGETAISLNDLNYTITSLSF